MTTIWKRRVGWALLFVPAIVIVVGMVQAIFDPVLTPLNMRRQAAFLAGLWAAFEIVTLIGAVRTLLDGYRTRLGPARVA